jgi:hypothetical protein
MGGIMRSIDITAKNNPNALHKAVGDTCTQNNIVS